MTKPWGNTVENSFVKTKLLNQNNSQIVKILNRKDFLEVSSKFRVRAKGLSLHGRQRCAANFILSADCIRVGFTCSRKVGNAVRRNSAKRRLRHLAREFLPIFGKNGWDYIMIGHNKQTEEMDFEDLKRSFVKAVNQIHKFAKAK